MTSRHNVRTEQCEAAASFGMLLRGSEHAGQATYDDVVEIANDNLGDDQWGYRKEFVGLAQRARTLASEPEVLLLDEPTANLDEAASDVVEKLILEYLVEKPACALWITHSVDQASRVSNRVIEMKGKSIHSLVEESAE